MICRTDSRTTKFLFVALVVALTACGSDESEPPEPAVVEVDTGVRQKLTVYSSASPAQVRPVLEAYTVETGVKTELVFDDFPRLAAKLANHGSGPAADLIIAAGVAELAELAQADLLRPTFYDSEPDGIAELLADPEHVWHALSYRARVIAYNADEVSPEEARTIVGFESLRGNAWRDRLCTSSSRVPGNRALIATLIRAHGAREAELIVRSWVANSAGRYFRHDTDMLQALAAGDCHVAIVGTNALAAYSSAVQDSGLVLHAIEGGQISQTDITGGAVSRHAENPEGAARLLEWLGTTTPNALFAVSGYEFPVNEDAGSGAAVSAYLDSVANPTGVADIAYTMEDAAGLAERARYP